MWDVEEPRISVLHPWQHLSWTTPVFLCWEHKKTEMEKLRWLKFIGQATREQRAMQRKSKISVYRFIWVCSWILNNTSRGWKFLKAKWGINYMCLEDLKLFHRLLSLRLFISVFFFSASVWIVSIAMIQWSIFQFCLIFHLTNICWAASMFDIMTITGDSDIKKI